MVRSIVLCVLLAGCATAQDNSCAAYEAFARRCSAQASEADYMAGWSMGYSETSFRQPN